MNAAPTVFGPDLLKAAIEEDFAAQEITGVEVLVGEWRTADHGGAPRVVIGLGKGQIDDPSGARYAGRIDLGDGRSARVLLERRQGYEVWVHSIEPEGTPPEQAAQRARSETAWLLDQTCAAMRRAHGGLALFPWPLDWIGEDLGPFAYGSVVHFSAPWALPIFDLPSDRFQPEQVGGDSAVDLSGETTPEETITTP